MFTAYLKPNGDIVETKNLGWVSRAISNAEFEPLCVTLTRPDTLCEPIVSREGQALLTVLLRREGKGIYVFQAIFASAGVAKTWIARKRTLRDVQTCIYV